jgi:uncharacterized integral membrane protein (TIGR00698 family)
LAAASYLVATLPGLKMIGPLTVALMVGIAVRASLGMPAWALSGTRFSARTILRLGIVLMGARLNFDLVARVGPKVLALDTLVILVGIFGIAWLGRRFGVPSKLAMLLAVGTSVCGASAVVAAGSVTQAHDDEITLAVALCGVLGTSGVFFFMVAGPFFSLTSAQLAILSGSTLHEVAQVMAAAYTWGTASGDLATLVKLTRVVLLAPTLLVLAWAVGRAAGSIRYSWKNPPIPWFVIGFLLVGAGGSSGLLSAPLKIALSTGSVFLMVIAMAAMGLNTDWRMMQRAGPKVLYAGIAGFAGLAAMSFALIRAMGI